MKSFDRDTYGGSKAIAFERTGFFQLAKAEGRWWFVTPESFCFLSHGVNHVDLGLMTEPYNVEHWARVFGVAGGATAESLAPGFLRKVEDDLRLLGVNTLGCHTYGLHHIHGPFRPYIQIARMAEDIGYYANSYTGPRKEAFSDVFSESFADRFNTKALEQVAPHRDDPLLIGYILTDCPVLTDRDAEASGATAYTAERSDQPSWPVVLRNLPMDAPGKQAYVALMRERHDGAIAKFNQAYFSEFDSFEALLRAENWRPQRVSQNQAETADNSAFVQRVLNKAYATFARIIRKHDPNHLIFGDVLNGNMEPPADIIRIAAAHFDAVAYQYYGVCAEQAPFLRKLAAATAKPLFHADSCFSVPNLHMPDPYGPHMSGQGELVREFREAYQHCFSHPQFVGWNWCGWMDSWEAREPRKQHSGVQDAFGNFYPVQSAMAEFSRVMYDVARSRHDFRRPRETGV